MYSSMQPKYAQWTEGWMFLDAAFDWEEKVDVIEQELDVKQTLVD